MPSKNAKQTSKSVATKASKILTDKRYGQNAKSVAGSPCTNKAVYKEKVNKLYRTGRDVTASCSFLMHSIGTP